MTAIVKCMTKGPQGPGLVNVLFTADPRDYGATGLVNVLDLLLI